MKREIAQKANDLLSSINCLEYGLSNLDSSKAAYEQARDCFQNIPTDEQEALTKAMQRHLKNRLATVKKELEKLK